ncbi:MAG: alpha/beta hydrolase [Opitutales bacterium]
MLLLRTLLALCALPLALVAQFYYPDRVDYGSPADQGFVYQDIYFKSSDGTKLHAWLVEGKGDKGTIIHFHGNAQNMSSHFRGISWLADQGFDLFLFDYRGYGRSGGKPTREGVLEDCDAAIRKAVEVQQDEGHFIVYGQSLGAANALALLGEKKYDKVKGVIAEAAFYSYKSVAGDKVGGIANLLISDNKSPHLVVDKIAPVPVLFAHGTMDRVVLHKHSKALYEKAEEPKEFLSAIGARHLNVFSSERTDNRKRLVETIITWTKKAADGNG